MIQRYLGNLCSFQMKWYKCNKNYNSDLNEESESFSEKTKIDIFLG